MPSSFELTPREIGEMRQAIHAAVRKGGDRVDATLVWKIQSLTDRELVWLTARMRPAELRFVEWARTGTWLK